MPQHRVRDLTEYLGIDKSLASRLARSLREQSLAGILRELPGEEGLRQVLEACAALGAPIEKVAAASEAVARLEEMIRALPGGRCGLATALALSGATDSSATSATAMARVRAERKARRSAFNAACFLQGLWVEAAVYGLFLGPGSTPDRLHQAMVTGAIGVRRLRAGPPITIGGVYGSPLNQSIPTRVTLAGEPIGEDPSRALLPEFCSGALDRLRADRDGPAYSLWLGKDDPPLDRPTTVVYGVKNLDFVERYKSDRYHYACTNYMVRRPTRLLVIEVFVWTGALGRGPSVRFSMDPLRTPHPISGPPADGREMLDQSASFVHKGRGFARVGKGRADEYIPIFAHAMSVLGWNPDEFERYRLEVEYPLGFVGVQTWFELDKAP